jgi:hypothetical protein
MVDLIVTIKVLRHVSKRQHAGEQQSVHSTSVLEHEAEVLLEDGPQHATFRGACELESE